MRVIKTMALWAVALLGFYASSAMALVGCAKDNKLSPVIVNLEMGRVIIPANAESGTVIAQTGKIRVDAYKYFYEKCTTKHTIRVNSAYEDLYESYTTYPTGIKGIGIRVHYELGSLVFDSGAHDAFLVTYKPALNVNGSVVSAELVLTSDDYETGVLPTRTYATVSIDGGATMLEIKVTEGQGGGVVVAPSCEVINGPNINVTLDTVGLGQFNKAGSTVGDKAFNIQLKCGGSFGSGGSAKVYTTFSSESDKAELNDNGVLANDNTDANAAKGIGIQVLKNGQALKFDEKYFVDTVFKDDQYFNIPLVARYYQYEDKASAGNIESHMTYNITYD